MGLATEYKEKKKQLESEIARYKSLIDATEEPIRVARSTQYSHASAVESEKFKKNGNYFFIAAGILLILNIIGFVTLYRQQRSSLYFGFTIIAFIIVFVIGIVRKTIGLIKYKSAIAPYGSVAKATEAYNIASKEVDKLCHEWYELSCKLTSAESALEELELAKIQYTGRSWDLRTFRATPENVRAMERDTENIYFNLQHMSLTQIRSYNRSNWMTLGDNNPNATGFQELGRSGSWKLQVTQVVLRFIHTIQLKNCRPMHSDDWSRLIKEANVRDAQTDDERQYLSDAIAGAFIMASDRYELFSSFNAKYYR